MSSMDTLKAARELEQAGMEKHQAEAVALVINEHGRADLVTRDYLDKRLWQQAVMIVGSFIAVASLFKVFG